MWFNIISSGNAAAYLNHKTPPAISATTGHGQACCCSAHHRGWVPHRTTRINELQFVPKEETVIGGGTEARRETGAHLRRGHQTDSLTTKFNALKVAQKVARFPCLVNIMASSDLMNSRAHATVTSLYSTGHLGLSLGLSMTYIHVGGASERAFAITVSPFLLTEELWPPMAPTNQRITRLPDGNLWQNLIPSFPWIAGGG